MNRRDRRRQLGLELGQLHVGECLRDHRIGPFEEVVNDLDLFGPGTEAGQRVDEALEPVVVLDDLLGAPSAREFVL